MQFTDYEWMEGKFLSFSIVFQSQQDMADWDPYNGWKDGIEPGTARSDDITCR